MGINKHSISIQIRFEWPRNLLTYFQEQGKGSCLQGVQSTCIVYSDLSSYVYLRSQLFAVGNNNDNTSPFGDGVDGFNSVILPRKLNRAQPNQKKSYLFGPLARCSLQECTKKKLQEVLCFFCLDLGCLHARGESYLSTGILDIPIFENESCDNSCCICTKKWHAQFIPVYRSSIIAFLKFVMQTGKIPVEVDYKDPISSLLAESVF